MHVVFFSDYLGFGGHEASQSSIHPQCDKLSAAIAVTLNERLDYFGQTVNIAARVQHLAGADEVYVSEDAYDAGVEAVLEPFKVESKIAKLRGIQQDQRVFCVSAPTDARAEKP